MVRLISYGAYVQQVPVGFPRFNRIRSRDHLRRRLFDENEINIRLSNYVHGQLGVDGPILAKQKVNDRRNEAC